MTERKYPCLLMCKGSYVILATGVRTVHNDGREYANGTVVYSPEDSHLEVGDVRDFTYNLKDHASYWVEVAGFELTPDGELEIVPKGA